MLPTPYFLILGGMSSGIQAIWPPRVAVLFQFGRFGGEAASFGRTCAHGEHASKRLARLPLHLWSRTTSSARRDAGPQPHARGPSRRATCSRPRPRSDDPETDDGPDPVGGHRRAEPPIHPFTGKFADPEHTVAYRSQAFRMMMPLALFAHRRDGTHDTGGDRGVLLVIAN